MKNYDLEECHQSKIRDYKRTLIVLERMIKSELEALEKDKDCFEVGQAMISVCQEISTKASVLREYELVKRLLAKGVKSTPVSESSKKTDLKE